MTETYEYAFVRLGEYAGSALFGVRDKDRKGYEDIVHKHARDGWRLVQIFASVTVGRLPTPTSATAGAGWRRGGAERTCGRGTPSAMPAGLWRGTDRQDERTSSARR